MVKGCNKSQQYHILKNGGSICVDQSIEWPEWHNGPEAWDKVLAWHEGGCNGGYAFRYLSLGH